MRFFHHCFVILISTLVLAACDSGNNGDTQAPAATLSMNDLLSPGAGIYRLRHGSPYAREKLEYLAYTTDSSAAYYFEPGERRIASSQTADPQTFRVLNAAGNWESRSWREETAAIRRTAAGLYTQEQSTGALAEISIDHVEDLSSQPIARHVPVLALLQSGVTLNNGAVFAPGSQRVILRGKVISDTYTLVQEAHEHTTIEAWMRAARLGQSLINNRAPTLQGVAADAVAGGFVTDDGKSGSWKKLNIHGMEMIVLLGGTPDNPVFEVNRRGAHPLLAMNDGRLMEGLFVPAGADAWRADLMVTLADHSQMDFNKTALDSIAANLLPGTFFGYGTPTHAATLLDEGINDMHVDNGVAFVDRQLLQEGHLVSQRFLLDFDIPSFSVQVPPPAPAYAVLDREGVWSMPQAAPVASISADGALLQSDGSWHGGASITTFRSLDISNHVMSAYEPLVDYYGLTTLEEGYFLFNEPNRTFKPGAKLISRQTVHQTAAYQLMTNNRGRAGFSTLSSLLSNTRVATWATGDMRVLVFPELSGPTSSGMVDVLGWGEVPYGTATWQIKRIGNTDMIVVSNTAAAIQHQGGDDRINIIFSVYEGQVYSGVEILPGHIDVRSGLILNRQALDDFGAGAVRF